METQYKILWSGYVEPPEINLMNVDEFFTNSIHLLFLQSPTAYDFEASGLDLMADCFWVRSVSFHNDSYSCSVQVRDEEGEQISPKYEKMLFEWIANQKELIAQNATYECGVMMRATGKFVKPLADTYILAKALSNEGFVGQGWSLDYLSEHLLEWPVYSKELDKHLKEKGLKKSEMCHADWEVLGKYNQLDSAATWEIYKRCKEAISDHWDTWGKFFMTTHQEDHMALLELQVSAYREGLTIDVKALRSYSETLEREAKERYEAFESHPKIAAALELWNNKILSDYLQLEPKKKYKQNGDIAVNYTKWENKKDQFLEDNKFNINSPQQLQWICHQLFDVYVQGDVAILEEKEEI
jgi:DNA polymerase I-like protein with 3'-5' exonuclease and polymerase domains